MGKPRSNEFSTDINNRGLGKENLGTASIKMTEVTLELL